MNTLIRYTEPSLGLSTVLEDLFNDDFFFNNSRRIVHNSWPNVDIIENDQNYSIKADLPGIKKDDIKVITQDGVLTISGERKEEKREDKKGRYQYYERSYGTFSRSFALPENVDGSNIEASFTNGTLELIIKKQTVDKPKPIEISIT